MKVATFPSNLSKMRNPKKQRQHRWTKYIYTLSLLIVLLMYCSGCRVIPPWSSYNIIDHTRALQSWLLTWLYSSVLGDWRIVRASEFLDYLALYTLFYLLTYLSKKLMSFREILVECRVLSFCECTLHLLMMLCCPFGGRGSYCRHLFGGNKRTLTFIYLHDGGQMKKFQYANSADCDGNINAIRIIVNTL